MNRTVAEWLATELLAHLQYEGETTLAPVLDQWIAAQQNEATDRMHHERLSPALPSAPARRRHAQAA